MAAYRGVPVSGEDELGHVPAFLRFPGERAVRVLAGTGCGGAGLGRWVLAGFSEPRSLSVRVDTAHTGREVRHGVTAGDTIRSAAALPRCR